MPDGWESGDAENALAKSIKRDLEKGKSRIEIIESLVRANWERGRAEAFVNEIRFGYSKPKLTPDELDALKTKSRYYFGGGLLTVGLGVAIDIFINGSTKVKWGGLVIGLCQILSGFYYWYRYIREQA